MIQEIIKLGWTTDNNPFSDRLILFSKDDYELRFWQGVNSIEIYSTFGDEYSKLIEGDIENIKELKTVLKVLGI